MVFPGLFHDTEEREAEVFHSRVSCRLVKVFLLEGRGGGEAAGRNAHRCATRRTLFHHHVQKDVGTGRPWWSARLVAHETRECCRSCTYALSIRITDGKKKSSSASAARLRFHAVGSVVCGVPKADGGRYSAAFASATHVVCASEISSGNGPDGRKNSGPTDFR